MLLPYRIETEIQRFPLFTYLLIAANVAVFIWMQFLTGGEREIIFHLYGFTPELGDALSLFTSMFIHAGWLHILGNMEFLWLFGRATEERLSMVACAALYFAGGAAGALLQGGLTPDYMADIPCIGASGAISAILGAYVMLYPWDEVNCLYFSFSMRYVVPITLSAIWVLGSWFVFQFVYALWFSPAGAEASVAYWAHIGGFAFGTISAGVIKYFSAMVGALRQRSSVLALERAADLRRQGDIGGAEAKLRAAHEASPSNALVLAELGRLELHKDNRSLARKLLRRSLKEALEAKEPAKAIGAFYALKAAGQRPPDNALRLTLGRRLIKLKKYGHALGVMAEPFKRESGKSEAELEGLDTLLYEIADLLAGPLRDPGRAQAAFGVLQQLFPQSPRSLDAEYQLRRLRAKGV
ncbi:MAG: hypothetical protein Kow0099_05080 [Candidatus Abyssubacteria bacterium]